MGKPVLYKYLLVAASVLIVASAILISVVELNLLLFFLPPFFILIGTIFIFLLRSKHRLAELTAFFSFFSVGLFWIAVSSYFRIYLDDYSQNTQDAAFFVKMATATADTDKLAELLLLTEGSFAVYVWRGFYAFFSFLGFGKPVLVGLLLNNTLMSLSCVFGIKTIHSVFGRDDYKSQMFLLLFCSCGIFWLFSSVHVRDSFVVFFVAILFFLSVKQMVNNTLKNKLLFFVSIVLLTLFFPFLRTEFYFIPAFFLLCTFLPSFVLQYKKFVKYLPFLLFLVALIVIASTLNFSGLNLLEVLSKGQKGYLEEIEETASAGSLGVKLVINQPFIIRMIAGSLYLQLYPIPFWYGFRTDTIYDFFKSIDLFFIWGVLPTIYIVFKRFRQRILVEKKVLLFSFLSYLFMVFAIAMTSLETRHLACFFIPLIFVASTVDFRIQENLVSYKKILFGIVVVISGIHLLWAVFKFVL